MRYYEVGELTLEIHFLNLNVHKVHKLQRGYCYSEQTVIFSPIRPLLPSFEINL